jgi:hypothetical protein
MKVVLFQIIYHAVSVALSLLDAKKIPFSEKYQKANKIYDGRNQNSAHQFNKP